jgi:D-glycero-D-manno-heptose 1,7-bisphosphate phosphatase
MKRPAVFFDRDGVVNVSPCDGYVLRWEDFHFSPGIIESLKVCRDRGYALVLVTSQQCVGKGLLSAGALASIHEQMQGVLRCDGVAFDAIEVCPHLDGTCDCRKPSPAMIFAAQKKLDLDLTRSWLIGDHDRDIQMAMNAGVPNTIRIASEKPSLVEAGFFLDGTKELPALLERCLLRW